MASLYITEFQASGNSESGAQFMATPIGTFDHQMLPIGWFDDTAQVEGWFDGDLLNTAPPSAPLVRHRRPSGVFLFGQLGNRDPRY